MYESRIVESPDNLYRVEEFRILVCPVAVVVKDKVYLKTHRKTKIISLTSFRSKGFYTTITS